MTEFVSSADGTRIAFDRVGSGPPLVLVSGIFCARPTTAGLAEALAGRYTVINYDRRGRGESGNTAPYEVRREVEDLAALIEAAGGSAAVYGHSSGAGLVVRALAAGLPITRAVLHEPPYSENDERGRAEARALAEQVRAALADDRRGDAVKLFLAEAGMPPEMVEGAAHDPGMLAVAPTMLHDHLVMDDFDSGGALPDDLVRTITTPTLVLLGGASPEFFASAARRLAALLPDARLRVLDGQDHGAPAEHVAPAVREFLS
ncbi:alpha/beta fold hydrolase [Nocardia puris]|uniref:Pimeloyl-ACP methyl ester carboxylesterase n=1 Tax=Nocardia puris TaxID=208602 RepID=A0A366DQP5_9NOCA|nr:alpha/beta hydrolase [Nocardia puris]RBO91604.1 pimeloyl-ACP methyl ester carboxylesterase [Nocardia puris]